MYRLKVNFGRKVVIGMQTYNTIEEAEAAKQILEYKLGAEASIVSMIYKKPDLLRETNLQLNDIHNNCWRVYFEIARDMIINEQKATLSEVDIGLYLEKHPKLADKYYNEYGGFQTIENAGAYIKEENFENRINNFKNETNRYSWAK